MTRSSTFGTREPFRNDSALEIQSDQTVGPLAFLRPTRAFFRHVVTDHSQDSLAGRPAENGDVESSAQPVSPSALGKQESSNLGFRWSSRDNRKGRHTLVISPDSQATNASLPTPGLSTSARAILRGISRLGTVFPYWDISYLVAIFFTIGSCVWVINAFFVWLPLVKSSTEFRSEVLYGGGISAFLGATIFELGSVLLMFEAINEDTEGCFGWALDKVFRDGRQDAELIVKPNSCVCKHHHVNRQNLVGRSQRKEIAETKSSGKHDSGPSSSTGAVSADKTWQWWPSRTALRQHYVRELGFLASFAQFCGATVFWISGFTTLPGINNRLSQGLLDGIYWTPQIVGGSGFIISGALYMLETQESVFKPAFGVLGWHIAFWNFIGALGFTLSGALGPAYGNSGAEYQASLATFWGSWAFLIGSVLQWYESLDKHPVVKGKA